MGLLFKIFAICILPIVTCQYQQLQQQQQVQQQPEQHDFLDIKSPEFFAFTPSPLAKPDSLRSQPYFDFLSTLYRHDMGKDSLFTPYSGANSRSKRDASLSPILDALQSDTVEPSQNRKRAIVFRPLFVYREQQIKKQRVEVQKRRY